MSTLLSCRLCLQPIFETIDEEEALKHVLYLDLIINKLFGINMNTIRASDVCLECNKSLLQCYVFYEKVTKAKLEFEKLNEASDFLNVENIKTEVSAADLFDEHLEDDGKDDSTDIKVELQGDEEFSEEDNIVLNKILSKLEPSGTLRDKSKKKRKSKKSKIGKKTKGKEKKRKDEKRDVEDVSDPKKLIDSNGIFVVKGKKLEALLSKFFILTCDKCDMKHSSLLELFEHYEKQHNVKGYVTCCGIKLDIYRKIKFHMAMHVQPSAFNCSICNKSVTRPAALKFHMLTHLPMAEKPIQCEECGKGFVHRYHLQKHKLLHLPMDQRPFFQCKICKRTFTVRNTYSAHMSIMHTPPKYLCTFCGKSFRDRMQFNNHTKRHNPDSVKNDERVKCELCGVVLAHALGLQQHMRRHESSFPCPHCDYITRRKVELKKHIQVRHTDTKPYVCVVCNKAFKLKYTMKVHMAQHTGERKFSCSFCPRTFLDPGNCYSHKKKMHPVELKNESDLRKMHPRNINMQALKLQESINSQVSESFSQANAGVVSFIESSDILLNQSADLLDKQ